MKLISLLLIANILIWEYFYFPHFLNHLNSVNFVKWLKGTEDKAWKQSADIIQIVSTRLFVDHPKMRLYRKTRGHKD